MIIYPYGLSFGLNAWICAPIKMYNYGSELLKFSNPKFKVMCGVGSSVSLFLNDVSQIPIVRKNIRVHKEIYKLFGSGIHHKPCYIFKSK